MSKDSAHVRDDESVRSLSLEEDEIVDYAPSRPRRSIGSWIRRLHPGKHKYLFLNGEKHTNEPTSLAGVRLLSPRIILEILLLLAYTAIFMLLVIHDNIPGYHCHKEVLYTPARRKVSYKANHFTDKPNNYRGNPSREVDDAWYELLKAPYFRLSEDDVRKLGRDPKDIVAISDSKGGYYGELQVFHLLHCINLIRMSYTLEYYPYWVDRLSRDPNTTLLLPVHIDHCLNEMRQAFMCNVDLTVLTAKWVNPQTHMNDGTPWLDWNAEHECRDWDDVMNFVRERRDYDINTGVIKDPTSGVAFGHDGDPGATKAINYEDPDR